MEAIPDTTILANLAATAQQKSPARHPGLVNRSGNDGTITRFGWKAQNKSLLMFAGEAYNVEQGVTNELFPTERDETSPRQTRPRNRRGGRAQRAARRAAGLRQDDARAPPAVDFAGDDQRRSAGGPPRSTALPACCPAVEHAGSDCARPFRAPHHTISQIALVRRRRSIARPGEISLAQHGVRPRRITRVPRARSR